MSRPDSYAYESASARRRKQEDLRRMTFRRAIEDYAEQRHLQRELVEYPELVVADYLIAAHARLRRSAPPAR